jgi:MFS transporter, PAT family, beta-lactamase induction signal transducer AmpG
MRTSAKLGLLATLYLSQGLPFGFFTQALPVLLREQGVGLAAIGLTSMLAAPWALKFLWAPYVDAIGSERFGRRRSWIVPLQIGAAALLATIAWLDATSHSLSLLLAAILLTNLLAATQDIATDGMAVEMLTPDERGLGNGVQVAGYRLGMIVGGGALLVSFHHFGWTATFTAAALVLLLATLPILLHDEPSRRSPKGSAPPSRPSLRAFVARPGMHAWLLVLLTYKLGEALATGMLRPFLVDLGLGLDDIGWLLGTAGFTAGLLGALFGGWAIRHVGRRRALLTFGALQVFAVGLYVVPALGRTTLIILYGVCTFEHFASGMATAALFTAMMDRCRTVSAATDYTVQASVVVLATGLASTTSGALAQSLGYTAHFVLATLASTLGLALAWAFAKGPHEQVLGAPSRSAFPPGRECVCR